MYSVDASDAQLLLEYTDVFSDKIPDLKTEIRKLNMHKAVSIICELIQVKDVKKSLICLNSKEYMLPFETILKVEICGINPKTQGQWGMNPLLRRDMHIVSIQMLLILLKKVIQYGNYETWNETDYEITKADYKDIIQLQLVVAEEISQKHLTKFDENHFLYSTYHLNYRKNVKNEFLRMYYIMEKISNDIDSFEDTVKKEYRDYYTDFTKKYEFTPTQYSSLLFCELNNYYTNKDGLLSMPVWRNLETIYEKIRDKKLSHNVIGVLSQPIEKYLEWAIESEDREWDFGQFFEFPFILDSKGNYVSICDITLINGFFEKIFWLIRDCYPKNDSRAMSFFGRLYEKYIQECTQHAIKGNYEYIEEFSYGKGKKSSDAYIRKELDLLVIEAKGFSVLVDCMTKNEKIEKNNEKLFVKPILQADACLYDVIDNRPEFEGVEEAYIISVTMDSINAVPTYYNEIHDSIGANKKCTKTKYYFNFNIEEYEMLLYLVEQQEDIFALLKEYYNEEKLKPFINYIRGKYPDVKETYFMEGLYKEAVENMNAILF